MKDFVIDDLSCIVSYILHTVNVGGSLGARFIPWKIFYTFLANLIYLFIPLDIITKCYIFIIMCKPGFKASTQSELPESTTDGVGVWYGCLVLELLEVVFYYTLILVLSHCCLLLLCVYVVWYAFHCMSLAFHFCCEHLFLDYLFVYTCDFIFNVHDSFCLYFS